MWRIGVKVQICVVEKADRFLRKNDFRAYLLAVASAVTANIFQNRILSM